VTIGVLARCTITVRLRGSNTTRTFSLLPGGQHHLLLRPGRRARHALARGVARDGAARVVVTVALTPDGGAARVRRVRLAVVA
jgi:hypothetical protein